MFKNLFGKKDEAAKAASASDPAQEALDRAIAEQKKKDPLIGVKICAQEVVRRLLDAMKDPRGVHVESVIGALGSLAGFACQMGVRAEVARTQQMPAKGDFMVMEGADGRRYFFGDCLNEPLAEGPYSVWSLVAGQAQAMGVAELLSLEGVFKHVSATVGGPDFGIPRVPEAHRPGDLPQNYVRALWLPLLPLIARYSDTPMQWPVLYGIAIQQVMDMGNDVLPPQEALRIAMECAVPASKLDPNALFPSASAES